MQEQTGNRVQSVAQFQLAPGAQGVSAAERRGPQRAANVARLPMQTAKPAAKPQPIRRSAANALQVKKAVGAEDHWQEF